MQACCDKQYRKKQEFCNFLIFGRPLGYPESESVFPIRKLIQEIQINTDPDPGCQINTGSVDPDPKHKQCASLGHNLSLFALQNPDPKLFIWWVGTVFITPQPTMKVFKFNQKSNIFAIRWKMCTIFGSRKSLDSDSAPYSELKFFLSKSLTNNSLLSDDS